MLRKMAFIAMAMVLVLGTVVSMASAAQNVANTNQKGSLLIWPLVTYSWEGMPTQTIISMGNDYYTEVWVKCYWVTQRQEIQDFMFRLTPNQPIWFSAYTGEGALGVTVPPFDGPRGELKCWAVNAVGDSQISFNHLYGSATILQDGNTGFEYNAWSFTARAPQNAPVGPGGVIELTGRDGAYDACPQYLVENFVAFRETPVEMEPVVALVPCKQDLRQDRSPTCTKAKFDIWNENETKYTGAWRCLKCWVEFALNEIDVAAVTDPAGYGTGADKFTLRGLHTQMARFRVTGQASTQCTGKIAGCSAQTASPFIGVLWHEIRGDGVWVGTTPHTAGFDGSGFVLWDTQSEPPQGAGR